MKKRIIAAAAVLVLAGLAVGASLLSVRVRSRKHGLREIAAEDIPAPVAQVGEGFAELADITMHYERYGESGKELILLHGNGGSCDTLRELAAYLGNHYRVYLIESRCHGQSSVTDTISYEAMAEDVFGFIEALGLDKPYFVGHSDGGMVGLALASLHPDSIEALVSCGSNSNPKTFKLYFRLFVRFNELFSPSILNRLMLEQPDFTEDFLGRIRCRTLIVAAEHDIMRLEDSVFIHESVPGSELIIVQNADHCSYIETSGRQAYILVREFLEK